MIFRSLNEEDLVEVVDIQLDDLQKRLEERQVILEVDDEAKAHIIKEGYDPMLGARPLARSIQNLVEDELAESFLNGNILNKSVVKVGKSEKGLTFSSELRKDLQMESSDESSPIEAEILTSNKESED